MVWMALLMAAIAGTMTVQSIAATAVGGAATGWVIGIGLAGPVCAYLIYAALVTWVEKRAPTELRMSALPGDLLTGLLIGSGMFALVFASLRLLGLYTISSGTWTDWPHDVRHALEVGLIEELLARLVIFRLLMSAFGRWPALIGSALLFGAAHLHNPNATFVAALAIAVEAGLTLAAFYLLTGRIWMSVGVHVAWNFSQGAIFGASVSGSNDAGSLFVSAPVPRTPELLTGGPFGPEASLPAIIVGGAVFLVVLTAQRRLETKRGFARRDPAEE